MLDRHESIAPSLSASSRNDFKMSEVPFSSSPPRSAKSFVDEWATFADDSYDDAVAVANGASEARYAAVGSLVDAETSL